MWYDKERNIVVYDVPDPRILSMPRETKKLRNGYVAMPASLYNMQIMRYLGHPAPPLMAYRYDWPRDRRVIPSPFRAQLISANFLSLHPRAFNLSDMGTGKTLADLWAADFVMCQYPPGACRALIVAPLSTLKRVWADALFQHFLGRRTFNILYGSRMERLEKLAEARDFYIINYEGLPIVEKELKARKDIRMGIIDEASAYRARGTERHKLGRALFKPIDYLWPTTGTPTANGPTDAWGIAKLVNDCFGESFNSFYFRTMVPVSKWKAVPAVGSHAAAAKLLTPSVRFELKDCVDIPPCTTQMRDVALSRPQDIAYRTLKKEAVLATKDGPISAVNEAVLRSKLIQVCAGVVYGSDANRTEHVLDCTPRLKVLRETVDEALKKVIIFAPFTSVIDMLHSEIKKWTPHEAYTCVVIQGDVSQKVRDQAFADFQDKNDPRILLAHPGTMAHGLTLTRATSTIWFSPTDKTELYLQANKRIDRPGQTEHTTIVQLAATPIEREVYKRLAANEKLQGLILMLARDADA